MQLILLQQTNHPNPAHPHQCYSKLSLHQPKSAYPTHRVKTDHISDSNMCREQGYPSMLARVVCVLQCMSGCPTPNTQNQRCVRVVSHNLIKRTTGSTSNQRSQPWHHVNCASVSDKNMSHTTYPPPRHKSHSDTRCLPIETEKGGPTMNSGCSVRELSRLLVCAPQALHTTHARPTNQPTG